MTLLLADARENNGRSCLSSTLSHCSSSARESFDRRDDDNEDSRRSGCCQFSSPSTSTTVSSSSKRCSSRCHRRHDHHHSPMTTSSTTRRRRLGRCSLSSCRRLLVAFILLVAIPMTTTTYALDACLTSINSLVLREAMVIDPTSSSRSYTLCAGTEFQIGNVDDSNHNEITDGQEMIPLRPNLHVKCGDTGHRNENCLIKGGDVHVDGTRHLRGNRGNDDNIILLSSALDANLTNIVIEGITFEDAAVHSLWLSRPGHVVFRDCEFRVSEKCLVLRSNECIGGGLDHEPPSTHNNYDFICSLLWPQLLQKLSCWQSNWKAVSPILLDYFDADDPGADLVVEFQSCSFVDNGYGKMAPTAIVAPTNLNNKYETARQPSLIVSNGGKQNRLIVNRCHFQNNDYVTNNTIVSAMCMLGRAH